jgi:anthranilate synthase component II
MLLLIDNYDSFTWNLVHFLGEEGAECVVRRNDALSAAEALAMKPAGIALSPGPGTPDKAGICEALIRLAAGSVPILGVCLGHQAIGEAYGGRIVRAPVPMHGKLSAIRHDGTGVFRGLPNPFRATRYHSLMVERASLPAELAVTAETEDGIVMGLAHRRHRVFGVQFHPESIATERGHSLLGNFLDIAGVARRTLAGSAA